MAEVYGAAGLTTPVMKRSRGTALVAFVIVLAIAQIAVEDILVFLGATGTAAPAVLRSPSVMVGIPMVLFLVLAGTLLGWAILTSTTLR